MERIDRMFAVAVGGGRGNGQRMNRIERMFVVAVDCGRSTADEEAVNGLSRLNGCSWLLWTADEEKVNGLDGWDGCSQLRLTVDGRPRT